MADQFDKVQEVMDLDRTNELFDSSIKRSNSHNKEEYTDKDIRAQKLVVSFGNLHVSTAKVKLTVERMRGYRDNTESLKKAVDRKIRNKNKYGGGRKTD